VQIAGLLRSKLRELGAAPHLLAAELGRFPQLLSRRGVRAQLMQEREAMLAQFSAEVEGLDADVRAREAQASKANAARKRDKGAAASAAASYAPLNARGRNESATAADISWALAMRSRAVNIATSGATLRDLGGYREFADACKDLASRLSRFQASSSPVLAQTTAAHYTSSVACLACRRMRCVSGLTRWSRPSRAAASPSR
jgi:hypothetical protein